LEEAVEDAVAVLDAAGVDRAHVVGHDWGGAVAWALAAGRSERLASATVLSTPHPRAMVASLWRSPQLLQSSYIAAFQLPVVPERLLLARTGALLRRALERTDLPARYVDRYVHGMLEPGALSAALGWYRALRPGSVPDAGPVDVPTTYLWSSRDGALSRAAAERTADHVTGPYRFEVAEGVSHWIPELAPDLVTSLVLDRVGSTS
jgi:pimeloyl-ACP methyl ester carboxylesterase